MLVGEEHLPRRENLSMKYLVLFILMAFGLNSLSAQTKPYKQVHFVFHEKYLGEYVKVYLNNKKVFSGRINNGKDAIAKYFTRRTKSNDCNLLIEVKDKDCAFINLNTQILNTNNIYIVVELVQKHNAVLLFYGTKLPVLY